MMYYVDTLLRNYEDALSLIEEYSGMIDEDFPLEERHKLFGSIWEIVETFDGIEKLLPLSKGLFDQASSYARVKKNLGKARALRNQRQHLAQNIRNHSRKRYLEPVHGIVMWNYGVQIFDDHAKFYTHCTSIDPTLHNFKINLPDHFEVVRGNFDNITLCAFGKSANVSQSIREFSNFCDESALIIEREINSAPAHVARSDDLPEEQRKPFNIIVEASLKGNKVLPVEKDLPRFGTGLAE
ncbi:hypothetical protein [Amaricoccus macauensis]|uniref:hypothetical protein n=1 Tax=Amaricoccus macauensis TaxID=57001 RepID=UPI003C79C8EB